MIWGETMWHTYKHVFGYACDLKTEKATKRLEYESRIYKFPSEETEQEDDSEPIDTPFSPYCWFDENGVDKPNVCNITLLPSLNVEITSPSLGAKLDVLAIYASTGFKRITNIIENEISYLVKVCDMCPNMALYIGRVKYLQKHIESLGIQTTFCDLNVETLVSLYDDYYLKWLVSSISQLV